MTYDYAATFAGPADVHDGDTFRVTVDVGFHIAVKVKIRLARCNCPELSTGVPGKAATDFTKAWLLARAQQLRVTVIGPDNYGDRWDAEVYDGAANLSDALLASGNAVPYP